MQSSATTSASAPVASSSRITASSIDSQAPSPLRSVTSMSGFTFPPIWSFPPFFTIQPNIATQAHQLTLWTSLILNWARHNRVFEVNVDAVDGGGDVFWNKAINRRLQPVGIRTVLGEMVKDGSAAPDPPKQTTTYLLYWRKPEEWGSLLYDWVTDTGNTSNIMTFYELTEGDTVEDAEFRNLPIPLLRKALDTLVKRGKAQLLKGDGEVGDGVRFL